MIFKIKTISFEGIVSFISTVEVFITKGLPSFIIVGLPDKSIVESKERIRSSLQSIGINLFTHRITVNLSPAGKEKQGTHYDLPIALAIMGALKNIEIDQNILVLGELSLDGNLIPTKGILLAAQEAQKSNFTLICPMKNYKEARLVGKNLKIICPNNLEDILESINKKKFIEEENFFHIKEETPEPFEGVIGQETAKRAIIISAAGKHHLMMIGPQGVGKSTLASSMQYLLPPLSIEDALEVTSIYSVSGLLKEEEMMIYKPPFRSPHSSSSSSAIIGGGAYPKPGEISLSHKGILFLDELPEFKQDVIDSLRTPIEEGCVHIARSKYKITYPSSFHLIVSMNPCKCGGFLKGKCICKGRGYMEKISAPIQDRIDLKVILENVSFLNNTNNQSYSSAKILIKNAIEIQKKRFNKFNSQCSLKELQDKGCVSLEAMDLLRKIGTEKEISVRRFVKLMAISRTIADLSNSEEVLKDHVLEALYFLNN